MEQELKKIKKDLLDRYIRNVIYQFQNYTGYNEQGRPSKRQKIFNSLITYEDDFQGKNCNSKRFAKNNSYSIFLNI